jgi:hypothetical protein
MPSWLPDNSIHSTHVGTEGFRNEHGAVSLLVVFEDRQPGAADGQAAAVERVHKLGLGLGALHGRRPVADVGAARLKGVEVGAGRNFAIKILAGQPDLEIVGLCRGEAGVAGAKKDAAIRQAERLENLFGIAREALVLGVGFLGARELDQLDLLELVLADDAARVFAGRAGLGAEARRVGREGDGQARFVENFVAIEIGDGDFGGGISQWSLSL